MKKLILHAGLPKTGTSALQAWCDSNRSALLKGGVCYPESDGSTVAPKHQFLMKAIFQGDMDCLLKLMNTCASDKLLLSTEGLSNHLYDFTENMLSRFRSAVSDAGYSTTIFVVSRDPQAWTRSYYKQAIINPPNRKYEYGGSKTLEEFSVSDRIKKLTDYPQLKKDLGKAFSAEVFMSEHGGDLFSDFISVLDMSDYEGVTRPDRLHESVSDDLIEIIRQVNGRGLPAAQRETVLSAVHECFKTKHQNIAASKRIVPFDISVFQRLVPANSSQEALKQVLLTWHKENIRSFFGFKSWA